MRELKVKLNEIEKLKEFELIVARCEFDVDAVSTANSRYVIDAKSVMGLLALDLSKPISIVAYKDDADADRFFEAIKKFEA